MKKILFFLFIITSQLTMSQEHNVSDEIVGMDRVLCKFEPLKNMQYMKDDNCYYSFSPGLSLTVLNYKKENKKYFWSVVFYIEGKYDLIMMKNKRILLKLSNNEIVTLKSNDDYIDRIGRKGINYDYKISVFANISQKDIDKIFQKGIIKIAFEIPAPTNSKFNDSIYKEYDTDVIGNILGEYKKEILEKLKSVKDPMLDNF